MPRISRLAANAIYPASLQIHPGPYTLHTNNALTIALLNRWCCTLEAGRLLPTTQSTEAQNSPKHSDTMTTALAFLRPLPLPRASFVQSLLRRVSTTPQIIQEGDFLLDRYLSSSSHSHQLQNPTLSQCPRLLQPCPTILTAQPQKNFPYTT